MQRIICHPGWRRCCGLRSLFTGQKWIGSLAYLAAGPVLPCQPQLRPDRSGRRRAGSAAGWAGVLFWRAVPQRHHRRCGVPWKTRTSCAPTGCSMLPHCWRWRRVRSAGEGYGMFLVRAERRKHGRANNIPAPTAEIGRALPRNAALLPLDFSASVSPFGTAGGVRDAAAQALRRLTAILIPCAAPRHCGGGRGGGRDGTVRMRGGGSHLACSLGAAAPAGAVLRPPFLNTARCAQRV